MAGGASYWFAYEAPTNGTLHVDTIGSGIKRGQLMDDAMKGRFSGIHTGKQDGHSVVFNQTPRQFRQTKLGTSQRRMQPDQLAVRPQRSCRCSRRIAACCKIV